MQVRIMETTPDVKLLEFTAYALQTSLQTHSKIPASLAEGSRNNEEGIAGLYVFLPKDIQHIVRPYLTSK